MPDNHYEHTWNEFGVNFFVREKDAFRPWGYTENFCGLDRLVLARNLQGRSPMMEDPDREVFSVSLTWPQSQKDKWDDLIAGEMKEEAARIERSIKQKEAGKLLKRDSRSNLVEAAKWKLMPDVINHTLKQSKSGLELSGKPGLPAGESSLMFELPKA